nr:LytTR family DNA-binding domain-containing protein [uncultured Arsenicibacter sp.]
MATFKVPGYDKPLQTDGIIWIQGDGNYSRIHYTDGKTFLVSQTLKWFEDRLTPFIRIHKSMLINPEHLANFNEKYRPFTVQLSNGQELSVSRRRIQNIRTGLLVVNS